MLDSDVFAAVRIWPARNVAGREDPRRARFEKGVHDDATVKAQPRRFGKPDPRTHADAGDDEIRLSMCSPLFEFHRAAVNVARLVLEMENDAVLLMQGADEVAHLRAKYPLHGSFVRRHDMNFDVTGAQRRRNLEADEAGAQHDRAACRLGAVR